VAVEKLGFSEKVENRVIENAQETGKNRLQSFLTRSNFCKFRLSEFFNSHPCSQQLFLVDIQVELDLVRCDAIMQTFGASGYAYNSLRSTQ
jgi:hypothetical protein